MKSLLFLSFIAVICISTCHAKDLILGTSYNQHLISQKSMEYMAIPFKKRVKEFFYSDPGQKIIKGIVVRESEHTQAEPIVTAGGIGFTYVNIRFKSERGSGLYYQVEIYV
ncbi:unnamed protein product [Chilo suppressalis]|uniref:REPAT31 protein n=1 Tax=Chilo suppressalis TaxID=168631 RepID=A0ABN8BB95_CHISP|nr:hypothetical protein evm_002565 [Chilo suppressalis]CAH0406506.1 unnamed protein product [Chilo suppressalis]